MSRIRTIKPDFWRDESLSNVSAEAALLAIGLLNHCDDEGFFNANPKLVQSDIFPLRDLVSTTTVLLRELESIGYLSMFVGTDGKTYGEVINFSKHQVINKKTTSKIKKLRKLPDNYGSGDVSLPSGMEWKGKEEEEEEANASVTDKSGDDSLVEVLKPTNKKPDCPAEAIVGLYHELMPDNPEVKVLNDARRKAIRARWKEAASLQCKPFGYDNREDGLKAWRVFFEVCAESDFLTGNSKPKPGSPPFIADIDFLMSPSGFAKCLENKYHREVA